jgi:hypothetical protein
MRPAYHYALRTAAPEHEACKERVRLGGEQCVLDGVEAAA